MQVKRIWWGGLDGSTVSQAQNKEKWSPITTDAWGSGRPQTGPLRQGLCQHGREAVLTRHRLPWLPRLSLVAQMASLDLNVISVQAPCSSSSVSHCPRVPPRQGGVIRVVSGAGWAWVESFLPCSTDGCSRYLGKCFDSFEPQIYHW